MGASTIHLPPTLQDSTSGHHYTRRVWMTWEKQISCYIICWTEPITDRFLHTRAKSLISWYMCPPQTPKPGTSPSRGVYRCTGQTPVSVPQMGFGTSRGSTLYNGLFSMLKSLHTKSWETHFRELHPQRIGSRNGIRDGETKQAEPHFTLDQVGIIHENLFFFIYKPGNTSMNHDLQYGWGQERNTTEKKAFSLYLKSKIKNSSSTWPSYPQQFFFFYFSPLYASVSMSW